MSVRRFILSQNVMKERLNHGKSKRWETQPSKLTYVFIQEANAEKKRGKVFKMPFLPLKIFSSRNNNKSGERPFLLKAGFTALNLHTFFRDFFEALNYILYCLCTSNRLTF